MGQLSFHSLGLTLLTALSLMSAAHASEGAPAPDREEPGRHWAFQPVTPPVLPSVTRASWPRQRLDYFVLARLESRGLEPAGEAGKGRWLRRVTHVLTGLPPTPEETEAFLADRGGEAHERVIDRLLASPHYGERMASLWLNLARYAEDQAHQVGSNTKHFYPNAHLYRTWVINAFNEDRPYDDFIRSQLAADRLTPDQVSELPALGFLGLGPKYYNRGRLDVMADEWEDRVDTVSRTFLGLTVACARCHDHKYDPITMADYYGLAGVFASTRMYNRPLDPGKPKTTDEGKKEEIQPEETMHIVKEGDPQDLHVFLRGNVDQKGPVAERRFLHVLQNGEDQRFEEGSGRRELAEAIASADNPLTARVMVNRLWALVFGRGLVSSPSNFGALGNPPTHPALLDDLAQRLVRHGWRLKPLLREMVLSATFRQDSDRTPATLRRDPDNQWLSGLSRRRLTAEMYRDALLMVSGRLTWREGPSAELSDPDNRRRTVYGRVSRLKLNDYLMQFDYPDANVHSAQRSRTTTPMQKLFLLNDRFMRETSEALAQRLDREVPAGGQARVRRAYRLLYGRRPGPEEMAWAREFLGNAWNQTGEAWVDYAQALLVANEMFYLD